MLKRKAITFVSATALAVSLTACSDDETSPEPTQPTVTETTSAPEDVLPPNPEPSATPSISPEDVDNESPEYDWEEYKNSETFLGLKAGDYVLPGSFYENDFYSEAELSTLSTDVLATLSYLQEISKGFELNTQPVLDQNLAQQMFEKQFTQNGMDKILDNLENYNIDVAAVLPGMLYSEDFPELSEDYAWTYNYSSFMLGRTQDGGISNYTENNAIPVVVNIEVNTAGADGELETFYITSKTEWFYTPELGWQIDNFYV